MLCVSIELSRAEESIGVKCVQKIPHHRREKCETHVLTPSPRVTPYVPSRQRVDLHEIGVHHCEFLDQ